MGEDFETGSENVNENELKERYRLLIDLAAPLMPMIRSAPELTADDLARMRPGGIMRVATAGHEHSVVYTGAPEEFGAIAGWISEDV